MSKSPPREKIYITDILEFTDLYGLNFCIGSAIEMKSNGGECCQENLRDRGGFPRVCSYDDSLIMSHYLNTRR